MGTTKFQSIKGTKDILPADSSAWLHVERQIRAVMDAYCYREIRTPIFEETSLFTRGIGQETDIVGKEMYTFLDKGSTSLTLRPEMTASVARAYIQHHLAEQSPLVRLYYIAPMFRQERPQAGRLRQFHQFGMESIGSPNPMCDAEIIAMAMDIYGSFGIDCSLKLNSVGDEHCRPRYREALRTFLTAIGDKLSPESQRRINTNVLRVLDSKDERDQVLTEAAPRIEEYLCEACGAHFESVKGFLNDLHIPFTVDHRLVRGLDYYTKSAFEIVSTQLGAQDALGGGGRYDALVEDLGGAATPAVGFAAGIERLLIVLEKREMKFPTAAPEAFIVATTGQARAEAFQLAHTLRAKGISVDLDFTDRSFKAQMREANRSGASVTIILGEDERAKGGATIKSMQTGEQQFVEIQNVLSYFDRRQ